MLWRTLLVFHLVLTTLELIQVQCAEASCSLVHSRSPFVPLSLTGLCINLALHPMGDVVAGLVQLTLGVLQAIASFTCATAPVLWKIYRSSGEEFVEFVGGMAEASTGDLEVQAPGSWAWDDLRHTTPHLYPRTQPWQDVALDPLASASEESLVISDCDDSGFESATYDAPPDLSTRRSTFSSPCPGSSPICASVDSSTHLDTLTLHLSDIALLGKHLARTQGMFAWRVCPLTRLSRDPGSDESSGALYQRIDAFLKPAGYAVHYVELLVEWVPSAQSDDSFLVFSPRASLDEGAPGHATDESRVIGTRVHAFRARKCDPSTSSSAEFLLNRLGLGSRWSCDWNWGTKLGVAFDGPAYSRCALKKAVMERWDDDVRTHWIEAGKTKDEADAWAAEVLAFEWACGWDEDDSDDDSEEEYSDSSEGSDVSESCLEDCSAWDEEDESEESEEEALAFVQPEDLLTVPDSLTETVPLADVGPESSSGTSSVGNTPESFASVLNAPVVPSTVDVPPQAPKTFRVVVEDASDEEEDEETVVYPRNLIPAENDEEELVLYEVPRTPLAVYPPNLRPSTPSDPLAHLRTVFAPIPTHAAGAAPPPPLTLPAGSPKGSTVSTPNAMATTTRGPRPLRAFYDCAPTFLPSWTPGLSFLEPRRFEPRVLSTRIAQLAGIGRARIPVSYTVALERKEGTENGVRAVITVHSRNPIPASAVPTSCACKPARGAPHSLSSPLARLLNPGPLPNAVCVHHAGAPAPGDAEHAPVKKKKPRRGGKKLTARRHRLREQNTQRLELLSLQLRLEADVAAREEGMVLAEVALTVDKQAMTEWAEELGV